MTQDNEKQQWQDKLRMAERVERVARDAGRKVQEEQENTDKVKWRELLLELMMGVVFLILLVGVATWDVSAYGFVYGSMLRELGVKAVGALAVTIAYFKGRRSIRHFVLGSNQKEVVRTIYKIAPELMDAHTDADGSMERQYNRKMVAHQSLILGFVLVVVLSILASPGAINQVIGLLREHTITATVLRIILAAFGVGVYFSLRNLWSIHQEYGYLHECMWKIHHLAKSFAGNELLKRSIPDDETSVTADKMKAVLRIAGLKGRVGPEDISGSTFVHHHVVSMLPQYVTAIMPIMGLIGTILGLTISIGGLEGVLSVAVTDRAAFTSNISQALQGIGTAFYTTLGGTIGMLVMKFFTMLTVNARSNFLIDLQNAFAVEVLPRTGEQNVVHVENDEHL